MATQPHITEDVDLARLQAIYDESIGEHYASATAFVDAAETIDWTQKDPSTIRDAIDMALSLNAIRFARHLADKGHELHPDDAELERVALVIAPPKLLERSAPVTPGIGASVTWLREHKGQYAGLWVALKSGELIGTAPTREALMAQLGPITIKDRILVARMG